jgi:hypothetical protein
MFPLQAHKDKLLCVLTESNLLVLKRNELVGCEVPPERSLKEIRNKDNVETELENSLNQIYKMRFMLDEDEVKPEETPVETEETEEDELFACCS